MRPKGNGLIEIVDEKSKDKGFFCMQLVTFINEDKEAQTMDSQDLWNLRFSQARNHVCAYRGKCHIYARTIAKLEKKPMELSLDFKE